MIHKQKQEDTKLSYIQAVPPDAPAAAIFAEFSVATDMNRAKFVFIGRQVSILLGGGFSRPHRN